MAAIAGALSRGSQGTGCTCYTGQAAGTLGGSMRNVGSTLDFDLGDMVGALRNQVETFSAKEIAPRAAEIDKTNEFPMDLWPKLGALGVLGVTVDEEYGG